MPTYKVKKIEFIQLAEMALVRKAEKPTFVYPCPARILEEFLAQYSSTGKWFPDILTEDQLLGLLMMYELAKDEQGGQEVAMLISRIDGQAMSTSELLSREAEEEILSLGVRAEAFQAWRTSELERLTPPSGALQ